MISTLTITQLMKGARSPFLFSIGVALAASLLSSCTSNKTVVRADDYDAETIVDYMNEESPEITSPIKPARKPSDSISKKHFPSTPIGGEWIIVGVGDEQIHQDSDMPYVIFSDSEEKFYASNGCNIINGDYKYTPGDNAESGVITFDHVLSTMAYCPDITYQQAISVVLNEGVTVKCQIRQQGRESYMELRSNSGDLLLTLRRHNLEVINGQWKVAQIGDKKYDGDQMNVFFDIPELRIHGNTGCNFFNGIIEIDPNEASAISFTSMGVTMKMCENADVERSMLVALEETTGYSLTDNSTLELKDASGATVMLLKRE